MPAATLHPPLSEPEIICLDLRAAGLDSRQAGLVCGLSPGSVRAHLASAQDKLDAPSVPAAVWTAMLEGILPWRTWTPD